MPEVEPEDYARRGFEGPFEVAAAQKAIYEAFLAGTPPDVGAILPPVGEPPMPWNVSGTKAMFAVWVRPGVDLPVPEGMDEADPSIVGRLVGG